MIRQRVRIRFRKEADLRLVSHRDLVVVLERLFRRVGLPLGMTEGFHPRPRMSFPSALALGIEAREEVFELELSQTPDAERLLADLRAAAPDGLEFDSVELIATGTPRLRVEFVSYELPVPAERRTALAARIEEVLAADNVPVGREGRVAPLDVRATLDRLELADAGLRMRFRVTGEAAVRPGEVVAALGLDDLLDQGCYLTRTEVALATG